VRGRKRMGALIENGKREGVKRGRERVDVDTQL